MERRLNNKKAAAYKIKVSLWKESRQPNVMILWGVSNAKSSAADRVISAAFLLSPERVLSPPARLHAMGISSVGMAASNREITDDSLIRLPTTSIGSCSSLTEQALEALKLQPADS